MYELNDDPDGLGPEEDIQPEELEDKSYHTAEAIIAFFLQLYGSRMKKKRRPGMGTMIGRNSSLGLTRSLAIKDDPDLHA